MSQKLPPGLQLEKVDDRIMTLNVGPQHPGSGHMRIILKIDGDYIVHCDPDPGYVHRGEEKMAEYRNYINILYMRMVYLYQFEIRKKDIVFRVCF